MKTKVKVWERKEDDHNTVHLRWKGKWILLADTVRLGDAMNFGREVAMAHSCELIVKRRSDHKGE